MNVTPITVEGEITGYLGVATDISAIKKAEEELQLVLAFSNKQNERLKNFAHIVSHNLRSHSGNLSALLEYLFIDRPDLKNDQVADMMKSASDNLNETIAHLSEVALLNSNELKQLNQLNLSDTVQKAISSVSALSKRDGVTVKNELQAGLHILGIAAYLDSIVLNFLTNAIKYRAPDRESYVRLFTTQDNDYLILHIEDNGQGIDLERNGSKLFGMYKTFHTHSDARGVGLFITRNQVEAMGGFISVESQVNTGTTFKIHFKYEEN